MAKKLYSCIQGEYRGYKCDSVWELAYIVYHLDMGIKIQRCIKSFPYKWYGKTRWYYPDFIVNGEYIEIKGVKKGQDVRKIENFPHPIVVLERKQMKPYLDYCRVKYGSDLTKLYEKKKTVWYKK